MTAQIETKGNAVLELCERLRQRRALKYSTPGNDQMVDATDLDMAIMSLVTLGLEAGKLSYADYARFQEAWFDL